MELGVTPSLPLVSECVQRARSAEFWQQTTQSGLCYIMKVLCKSQLSTRTFPELSTDVI